MSAAATARGWERRESANTVRQPLSLAPAVAAPRAWLRVRLLDLSHLPPLRRLLAFVYYRVLRQPPAFRDGDGSLKFHDLRSARGSRREVRRLCRDADDVVIGVVYGDDYGARVAEEVTFCRPLHPAYAEQDARDSLLYPDSLEGHFARRMTELVGQAERVIEKCGSV